MKYLLSSTLVRLWCMVGIFALLSVSSFAQTLPNSPNVGNNKTGLTSWEKKEIKRVSRIIKSSRHLGAHGLGYNFSSLLELKQKLTAQDTPYLLYILEGNNLEFKKLTVGASFGLTSLCDKAIPDLKAFALKNKMVNWYIARETLERIQLDGSFCSLEEKKHALDAMKWLDSERQHFTAKAL